MILTHSTQDRKWVFVLMAALSVVSVQAGTLIMAGGASTGGGGGGFSVSGVDFSMSGSAATTSEIGPCRPMNCIAPGSYSFYDSIGSEATPGGMSGVYSVDGVFVPLLVQSGHSLWWRHRFFGRAHCALFCFLAATHDHGYCAVQQHGRDWRSGDRDGGTCSRS